MSDSRAATERLAARIHKQNLKQGGLPSSRTAEKKASEVARKTEMQNKLKRK